MHRYNPPLDEGYKALLKEPHVSYNSRLLNSALALGSQGTFPGYIFLFKKLLYTLRKDLGLGPFSPFI